MNSFIKNNKWFFSLVLGVLLNGSLHGMIIDGHPLSDVVPPNQSVNITFPKEDDVMMLKMEKGVLNSKSMRVDAINHFKEVFQKVIACKSNYLIKNWEKSASIVNEHASHIVGEERINLQAKTLVRLTDCLLESPSISILGNKMSFDNCFLIKPKCLTIIGDRADSNYNIIQIIFRDNPQVPTIMFGKIDLNNDETKQELVFSNVQEIRVLFNSHAWNKDKEKTETKTAMYSSLFAIIGTKTVIYSSLFAVAFLYVVIRSDFFNCYKGHA